MLRRPLENGISFSKMGSLLCVTLFRGVNSESNLEVFFKTLKSLRRIPAFGEERSMKSFHYCRPTSCSVFLSYQRGRARSATDVIIPAFSSESNPGHRSSLPPSLPRSLARNGGLGKAWGKWPVSRQTLVTKQQFTCHGQALRAS